MTANKSNQPHHSEQEKGKMHAIKMRVLQM
jgi:hypothetical protein